MLTALPQGPFFYRALGYDDLWLTVTPFQWHTGARARAAVQMQVQRVYTIKDSKLEVRGEPLRLWTKPQPQRRHPARLLQFTALRPVQNEQCALLAASKQHRQTEALPAVITCVPEPP